MIETKNIILKIYNINSLIYKISLFLGIYDLEVLKDFRAKKSHQKNRPKFTKFIKDYLQKESIQFGLEISKQKKT